ncbi:MAG: hypothetical protein AB7F40_10475 [Victivallaceae bacterium]|nr:hypothetical protein [Victivallaceae bacterium]
MKNFSNVAAVAAILASAGTSLQAGDATAPYKDSRIDARLNLEIEKDTQVVHFIRDNADPDVITKTYVLKHADPYEIRAYLREIVQTRRVDESDSGITAVKYNDGTGIVMISAEDYRFEDSENGQGIDSIVETLDQPKIASVTGQPVYVYVPKYRPADELKAMVRAAGADIDGDPTENIGGSDRIKCDPELNLMLFKTTRFSRGNIDGVLKTYDRPYPEIRAKVTVYELDAENDAKLGLDFQSWKNNDGIDLFNGGARFMQNYAPDGSVLTKGTGWSDTKYYNFNPKWNTKYIDFLVSKGKAKVMTACELTLRNRETAEIERTSQMFLATSEPAENGEFTEACIYLPDSTFVSQPPQGKTPVTGWNSEEVYVLNAISTGGKTITIAGADVIGGTDATVTVLKLSKDVEARYFLTIDNGSFEVDGRNVGSKVQASVAEVTCYTAEADDAIGTYTWTAENVDFDTGGNITAWKGNRINTTASNEFGFHMSITPSVTDKATMLDVSVSNSSLIGYTSTGEPRIQNGADVASQFMISNEGTRLVIGGIEKRDVVSVSGGIPLLKDLPLLGWAFSTESESTKKSQLLVVAEVLPVRPGEVLAENDAQTIKAIEDRLGNAGEKNTFGYRQYLIDTNRNNTPGE